jgi:serine/threonine protein kinase
MRFVHSQGFIHGELTTVNILLDFDWNVRICDFGHSLSLDHPKRQGLLHSNRGSFGTTIMSHYAAPEVYNDMTLQESDVFSFGVILYELILGRLLFSNDVSPYQVMLAMVQGNWRPGIPETVIPVTAELIRDCLAVDYRVRPLFDDILERLKEIEFKLIDGVNSVKITEFVAVVEYWECMGSVLGQDETSKAPAFGNRGLFDERIQRLIHLFPEHRTTA